MKRKHIIIGSVVITFVALIIFFGLKREKQRRLNFLQLNTVCFEKDILPVFRNNCGVIGCHDLQSASGSYIFVDYNTIIRNVVPFKPEKSIVYKSIYGKGVSSMPPGQELTENEKLLITVWIGQGAGNTVCHLPFIDRTTFTSGYLVRR